MSVNNYDWAQDLLEAAHLPVGLNLCSVVRWMAAENPARQWFRDWDPLNAYDFVGPGAGWPGWFEAALGTADVLKQPNMWPIFDALTNHVGDLAIFSIACHAAPWAADRYYSPTYIAEIPQPPVIIAPGT